MTTTNGHHAPTIPTITGPILIVGYGTLMSAEGINSHDLHVRYRPDMLKEVTLHDYARGWEAVDGDGCYLGVSPAQGKHLNGVVFEIWPKELHRFLQSEGADSDHGQGIYKMVDVSDKVTPEQGMPVYTLVTKHPTDNGVTTVGYITQVQRALDAHNKAFKTEYHKTTPLPRIRAAAVAASGAPPPGQK